MWLIKIEKNFSFSIEILQIDWVFANDFDILQNYLHK